MPTLPAHPDLEQLRRQAKELLRAARAGDPDAAARVEPQTLAGAQLAVARGYGFSSWPALKSAVQELGAQAEVFVAASVSNQPGRAFRMLTPELAGFNMATAAVLGDAARVLAELERDPGLATRQDPRSGWTALHLACASRWHRDPARAAGLVQIAQALLDGGASLEVRCGQWTALRCTAAAGNAPVARLLLDRGAVPEDGDLYLAALANHETLTLLLAHTPDVAGTVEMALAAPISTGDVEAVRVLLDAGADPGRYRSDGEQPASALYEAVASRVPAELVELLREHGAERHVSQTELFLLACLDGDREGAIARRQRLAEADQGAIVRAAQAGNVAALELMLELGFTTTSSTPSAPTLAAIPPRSRPGQHRGTERLRLSALSGDALASLVWLARWVGAGEIVGASEPVGRALSPRASRPSSSAVASADSRRSSDVS